MPYLKVEEYINAPTQELIDKLHEEFNEVIEEIDDPCSPVETLISELHDLAQICNTHIHRLCKVNNLDYDAEYKKHKQKIYNRVSGNKVYSVLKDGVVWDNCIRLKCEALRIKSEYEQEDSVSSYTILEEEIGDRH